MAELPKLSTSAPDSKTFKVHVGIDFGGDGVALSYAFGKEQNVMVHSEWGGRKFKAKFKPKTIILLDEYGEPIGFGKDAKNTYISTPKMKDKWMLFERFKMSLYDHSDTDDEEQRRDKIEIKDKLKAVNGLEVSASVVFIAAFKYLQGEAKKYLKRNKVSKTLFKTLNDSDYQWILTVPAIWNDEAKSRMRQWIIKAGLVNKNIPNQCKIVYESDCAALAIQHEINNNKALISGTKNNDDNKENYDNVHFRKGERYILVLAGGGTTDIACHEILGGDGEYGAKEILAPSGGPWGSCYIDDEFITLLTDIFGSNIIKSLKHENPALMTELLDNFQETKKVFFEKENERTYNVRIPYGLIDYIEELIEDENDGDDIEDVVERATVFGKSGCVEFDDEYLSINKNIFEIMFNHVIAPIISHVKKLLNKSELNNGKCKYLCLAGGLAASPYFRFKMAESFGAKSRYRLTVISPKRPILSVVEGAAYFGITPNYIKARILKYTYGYSTAFEKEMATKRGISSEYIEQNKYYNEYKKTWFVDDCFKILANKGKLIESGAILSASISRRKPTQSSVTIPIYVSEMQDPKIVSNGRHLGTITAKFPDENKEDMKVTVEFHFGETVINAVVYRNKEPDQQEIQYITNYK